MKTYKLIIAVLVILGFTAGCKKKSDTLVSESTDSLKITYTALLDSVNATWNVMIADDDEKHMLMKRLLLEVSYTNNYDKEKFNELNGQVDALNAMRYDQQTMESSPLIDAYDSATWAVADNIIEFARNHPRYQDIPLMEELINDINEKNSFVLIHRIHYDTSVKALNAFLETYGESARAVIPTIKEYPMPLFELPS
jgi:hypothetical protein